MLHRFFLFLVLYDCLLDVSPKFSSAFVQQREPTWKQIVTSTVFHSSARGRNYDDADEDDDEPPEVDVANFKAPTHSFGYGRGRSSPSIRKAVGMPSKSTAQVYVCTNCGSESVQWRGKCPTCEQWNTLQEFQVERKAQSSLIPSFRKVGSNGEPSSWLAGVEGSYERPVPIKQVNLKDSANARVQIPFDDELNAVLGGGLLKGSLILLGGDPGVGKSTLALQLANALASLATPSVGIGMGKIDTSNPVGPVWYISGEETMPQIATRAQRLDSELSDQLFLLSETNVNVLADQVIQQTHPMAPISTQDDAPAPLPPSLLIVDSIQTIYCEAATGSPGGISQVRECMALLLRLAKTTNIPIIVIGHVTKTGDVAGPRMVEHMVDAVLYLEGAADSNTPYRWLRATKNRFGSTQVVGLYEFIQGQLRPSPELDLATLPMDDLEGCAMSIAVEGLQRAMTLEVQALVALNAGGFGRKTVNGGGLTPQRLQLLLGVLQKHCGVFVGKSRDVYVNVVGGSSGSSKQQSGTALDLAVAIALTSSLASIPVRGDTVFLAQVGLLGELRPLSNMEARLLQAERMGFSRAIVAGKRLRPGQRKYGMEYLECPTLKQALELGLTAAIPKRAKRRDTNDNGSTTAITTLPGGKYPEAFEDLELNDVILDDEDDESDYYQ
jgi:DNA repair protein RadA/Sms